LTENVVVSQDSSSGTMATNYAPVSAKEPQFGLGVFTVESGKTMAFVTDLKNQSGALNGVIGLLQCK
jgi:hypothetical protein